MLPGEAPGRGAPGRGAPGRGAIGRGIGRSTGCAEENGLLPTRGVRAAGLGAGRGPGVGPGRLGIGAGPACGCSATGAGGACGSGAGGADGLGAAGFLAAAGAASLTAPLASPAPLPAVLSCAGLPPPNDSRSRRATGASTVDDADLTNSPCSLSRASTSLLVTPSSLANSCTRALPATTSPVYEATAVVGRASGLAMTHGHRDFTVCSCSLLPVLLAAVAGVSNKLMCSTTADASGAPVIRNARANARRRIASCAHFGVGCTHAPRPGRVPAGSTVTAHLPFPVDTATTRSSSTANSRFRHPTHVRTGPSMRRCGFVSAAEVSRWITAQFTHTPPVVRTTHEAGKIRLPGSSSSRYALCIVTGRGRLPGSSSSRYALCIVTGQWSCAIPCAAPCSG
jgi:hypothetical protein